MRWRGRVGGTAVLAGAILVSSACAVERPHPVTRNEILQRILPSAAQIIVERAGHRVRSGSSVVVGARASAQGPECYALTSGHNLGRSAEEEVYIVLGGEKVGTKIPADVLIQRQAPDLDLALLRVSSDHCPVAQLGEPPELGDPIWVLAFPWGRHMTLISGVVSQLNEEAPNNRETGPRLMVDASVSYGASGGGVFDAETGRLVGLVDSFRAARVTIQVDAHPAHIDLPVPGETFLTPIADIRRFLTEASYADLIRSGDATGPRPRR
jgi:S1-C subfamily serine protease